MPNKKAKKSVDVRLPDGARKVHFSGVPQKKQLEFFMAHEKYVAYGGARGGGKSWALRRKIILMCLRFPGLSVLLVRRTYGELLSNHVRVLVSELDGLAEYTDSRKCFEFYNGSVLRLGYLDSENDTARYQGMEYDVIAIDEATQFTEYQFQTLKATLRGTNGYPKRMYLTCNPGGVGHGWVKRLFIDRDYREGEKAEDYAFIPASVYDNPALLESDPDYLEQLKSLPKGLREAWLDGSWGGFEGQFFPEFDYEVHTLPDFVPDAHMRRVCAIDYGLDMLAALFVAVDEKGEAYVYDEVYKSGLVVSAAAREILAKADGVDTFLAPSDLWSRQKDSGRSMAELFSDNGVYLTKLSSERIQGWSCLKEWMKVYTEPDGSKHSALHILRRCTNLIRCLPLLLYDRSKPGDAAVQPHEITHAPDALRYFAASRVGYSAVSPQTAENKRLAAVLLPEREKRRKRCLKQRKKPDGTIGR